MAVKYISPQTMEDIARHTRNGIKGNSDDIGEVNIVAIAYALDCSVEIVNFNPDDVAAKVERRSNGSPKYTIQIARKDGPRRQRFSIAHEVAHIILHDDGKSKDKFIERRQPLTEYKAADLFKETQANMLAAALLMPEDQVREIWRQTRSIDDISEIFNVSPDAAANRASSLGLLSDE